MVIRSFALIDAGQHRQAVVLLDKLRDTDPSPQGPGQLAWRHAYAVDYHEAFGFFEGRPAYDVVRNAVLDKLAGKTEAMSSSTR